jgi:hypothetical protein
MFAVLILLTDRTTDNNITCNNVPYTMFHIAYVVRKTCIMRAPNLRKFNRLKTKSNLLYISNQSVPRCKRFPLRL